MSALTDRLRELADELERGDSTLTPIPGRDLKVGDVYLPQVGRRMQVEKIEPWDQSNHGLIKAYGLTTFADGFTNQWSEAFYPDAWVVVERHVAEEQLAQPAVEETTELSEGDKETNRLLHYITGGDLL